MKYFFSIALISIFLVGIPGILLAQDGQGTESTCPPGKVCLPNPLGTTATAKTLIDRIIGWLLALGAPVAAIMIIYGAFQMLFAGGNPDNFTKGRNTILYAAVGYGIIFIGWGLVSVIEGLLTTNP